MKLHNYWRSSSSWRIRIALAHKNLEYEYALVHLIEDGGQQNSAEFGKKNPSHQVPVLEIEIDGETRFLGQSMAIFEYLEEAFPTPAFLPSDQFGRARTRQLAEVINAGTQPMQNLTVIQKLKKMDIDAKAWCVDFIGAGLTSYQSLCLPGPFSVGEQVSWADACLIPQLYNARRFEIDVETTFPRLAEIEKACMQLSAFSESQPSKMPEAT